MLFERKVHLPYILSCKLDFIEIARTTFCLCESKFLYDFHHAFSLVTDCSKVEVYRILSICNHCRTYNRSDISFSINSYRYFAILKVLPIDICICRMHYITRNSIRYRSQETNYPFRNIFFCSIFNHCANKKLFSRDNLSDSSEPLCFCPLLEFRHFIMECRKRKFNADIHVFGDVFSLLRSCSLNWEFSIDFTLIQYLLRPSILSRLYCLHKKSLSILQHVKL